MVNYSISSLASLKKTGKSVAFISGNRDINEKNIKSKKDSFDKFKCNLVPLMYVDGQKAIDDGCTIVDALTGAVINSDEASSYIVIIDGQHRFKAAIESELPYDNIYLFENFCEANTRDLLTSTNVDTCPWDAHDYIHGAALTHSDDEIVKFAKELSNLGYPPSTIGEIICFRTNVLKKTYFVKIMQDEKVSLNCANINRAKKFLDIARTKFDDKFISRHYLIRTVVSLSIQYKFDNVATALGKLTETQIKTILRRRCHEKEDVIRRELEVYLKN